MTTMTISDARARMREVVELARSGHDVELTQHGEVVAVLVSPRVLRTRRVARRHPEIEAMLARRPADAVPAPPGFTAEEAEELITEIRRDRDAR